MSASSSWKLTVAAVAILLRGTGRLGQTEEDRVAVRRAALDYVEAIYLVKRSSSSEA